MAGLKSRLMDLAGLRQTIRGIGEQLQSLDAEIEQRKREREELQTLPLPKEDLVAKVLAWVDREADRYPAMLGKALGFLIRSPGHTLEGIPHLSVLTANTAGGDLKVKQEALLFMLREPIKAGIRQAIEAMDYPAEVGPPEDKRPARIARLDREIAELEAERAEIVSHLDGSGIHVERSVLPADRLDKYAGGHPIGPGAATARAKQ